MISWTRKSCEPCLLLQMISAWIISACEHIAHLFCGQLESVGEGQLLGRLFLLIQCELCGREHSLACFWDGLREAACRPVALPPGCPAAPACRWEKPKAAVVPPVDLEYELDQCVLLFFLCFFVLFCFVSLSQPPLCPPRPAPPCLRAALLLPCCLLPASPRLPALCSLLAAGSELRPAVCVLQPPSLSSPALLPHPIKHQKTQPAPAPCF